MTTTTATTAPTTTPPAPRESRRPTAARQLRALSGAILRTFVRDKTSLFFTFLFPLMFLVVFGFVFRGDGTSTTSLAVVGDGTVVTGLPEQVVEPVPFDDIDAAVQAVKDGDLPGALMQQGDEVTLYYAASDQVQAGTVQQIVSSVVNGANLAATGQPPALTLTTEQVESEDFEPIQFLAPGILSWGVATSAAFGAALTLVAWRNRMLLRRLRLSPAPVWTIVAARVGVSMLIALAQAALFLGVAVLPTFGLQLSATWWLALPVLLCGTLSFLAVGLFIGAVAKSEESASALANFVVLPMAFLSGVFFDMSAAPPWMGAISRVLPLGWMNDGITDVLVRGAGIEAVWLPCLVLLGFAVVVGAGATRVFRWEPR